MYNSLDVHWDVLSNPMSRYFLRIYHILGLNGVLENPRGHQAGRMGKAKVKMMMIICTWKLHKSSLYHVTWAPKLGSPVAIATV